MSYAAKDEANKALEEAEKAYKSRVDALTLKYDTATYQDWQLAKRRLAAAKKTARQYWTQGDPPII